ncbi:MAG: hypothetical protein JO356_03205 [Acidobacteria bacterium]|nr:hypothetical protein [Acidobacteriota bacterium]
MNQLEVIEFLLNWLKARLGSRLTLKADHVGVEREELALYLGPKLPRKGRQNRIAEVDIIAINETSKSIEFIVEVEPDPTLKKLFGNLMPVAVADNHTPSNRLDAYKLEGVVFFYLTLLSRMPSSSKSLQYQLIEPAIRQIFAIPSKKFSDVRLCHGKTVEEIISKFQSAIENIYFPVAELGN